MNPGKNGLTRQAHGATQVRGQQTGKAQPHRPGIMQPKMPAAVRPKAFGAPHAPKQPTTAVQPKRSPAAPPVYRPQPAPGALQAKMPAASPHVGRTGGANGATVAPPVYRPQPTPKVLQTKASPVRPSPAAGQTPRTPAAPPVYRPEARKTVQPKMAGAGAPKSPQAPPVYRPQPAPRVLQTKTSQTMAAAAPARHVRATTPHGTPPAGGDPRHAMQHKTRTPPFSPARGLVQAFIIEDTTTPGTYISDGARPSSHLNVSTLEAMAEEIISGAPLNDVETELVTNPVNANVGWDETDVVKDIRKNNLLSQNAFAVCHKIPYASFEKVLLGYINNNISSKAGLQRLSDLMHAAEGINHGVAGTWHSSVQLFGTAIAGGVKANIESTSRSLLLEFDGAPDNLYFGFATTNSSIGQSADLHYNILSVGALPEAPTPRGANLLLLLNSCESQLGLSKTTQIEWVGKWKLPGKWVMTSGAHGKKTQDAGMVLST